VRNLRRTTTAGLAAVTLILITGSPVQASNGPVSHGSPFDGCTVGGSPTSTLYPGAEVEPSVAGNRFLPGEVVGAWQQDRWSDGGARGIAAAFSRDGGRSFTEVTWPVSRCAPGGLGYDRASDPWVSIGPEGVVYGSALSFDVNTPRNTVAATTSYDGGRTWRNTTVLIDDTEPGIIDDKNSVTADPTRLGSAYQVWDRLRLSPDGVLLFDGPTLLSITRDFGRTWSTARVIVPTAQFQQTIGNTIVVDRRTGTLYNFYNSIQYTDATATAVTFIRFEMVRSTDPAAPGAGRRSSLRTPASPTLPRTPAICCAPALVCHSRPLIRVPASSTSRTRAPTSPAARITRSSSCTALTAAGRGAPRPGSTRYRLCRRSRRASRSPNAATSGSPTTTSAPCGRATPRRCRPARG